MSGDKPGNPRANALLLAASPAFALQHHFRTTTAVMYTSTMPSSANPTQTQFIHVGHGSDSDALNAAIIGSSVVLVRVPVVTVMLVLVMDVAVLVVNVVDVLVSVVDVVTVVVVAVLLVTVVVVIVLVVAVRVVSVRVVVVLDVALVVVAVLVVSVKLVVVSVAVVDVVVIFSVHVLPRKPAWQAQTTSTPFSPSDASQSPCPHGLGLQAASRVSQYVPVQPPRQTQVCPTSGSSRHESAFSCSGFMQGSAGSHVGNWQRSPTKPAGHSQVKFVIAPMHSPPCRHAFS